MEAFWTEFLRGRVVRGLVRVRLAISDAYQGHNRAVMALAAIASIDVRAIDPP